MTPLARLFYAYLLACLADDRGAWVNYKPMAQHFRPQRHLSWRGGPMHEALGEIITWCRARGLGALPAIVVRIVDGVPGDGFFAVAFPGIDDPVERRRLWEEEVERVREDDYPVELG